ncbi:MAG: Na/Pi symporter, partial [Haliea sp.]
MAWLTLTMSLGGLGLLLLGMGMMTDGLKAAAGNSLQGFLERSTQTRLRAAMAGFGITALVQSSSAVIVATLGFTNAGMLRLKQAAWVVFGSNVGTTMTAWIVALVGLRIKVELIALPLIGIGMLLKLFFSKGRSAHV